MTSFVVQSPGMLTTVQDLGRPGFGVMGISASGAADPIALRLGNLLVGNAPSAAGLEMTLLGGSFIFPEGAVIAVTGADFGATLDGKSIEMWTSQTIPRGGTVQLGSTRNYARCYVAIAGGIVVPSFLGSSSTHLLGGLGGYHGRALQKGDVLSIGEPQAETPNRGISQTLLLMLKPRKVLRVTEGPQANAFSPQQIETFVRGVFTVSEASDRTGLRLVGPPIDSQPAQGIITEGTPLGAIQITPSGQPIILSVDQQTTGGYPKIANVIGVDLHRVGQLRPRVEIRFERTSLSVARCLWIEQERLLASPAQLFS